MVETSGVSEANLADKIQHAKTPTDHQDIARYYEAEAQTADRKTEQDYELKRGYQRDWPDGMPGPAGMVGAYGFQAHEFEHGAEEHYDHLSERSKDESREYHALADEHRRMAAQLERGPRRADE